MFIKLYNISKDLISSGAKDDIAKHLATIYTITKWNLVHLSDDPCSKET